MKKLFKKLLVLTLAAVFTLGVLNVFAEEATEKQTVKIAIATCFTGDGARGAATQLVGLKVALQEIEESGYCENYTFELLEYDDKYDATEAVTVANKLVWQDGCKAVFGHLNAVVTLAGMTVYDEAEIPCFTPSGSSAKVVDGTHPSTYLCVPQDRIIAATLINYLVDDLGKTNIAIMYSNNDQGTAGLEFCEAALEEKGMAFADEETYAVGDTDFSGQFLSMKQNDVDCVVIWGGEVTQRATMIKSIKQILGEDCVISGDGNFSNASFIEATTAEDRAGVIYPVAWSPSFTDERSQKYVEEFKALDEQGGTPGAVTVRFYDGMYLLATALNNMGVVDVDSDDFIVQLNAAIKEATYDGLQGTLAPQENGECLSASYVVTYDVDGNEVLLK